MAQMGKPINNERRSFQNVQMAPRRNPAIDPNDIANSNRKVSDREKERLLNKLTGFKQKNDLVVDGRKHNVMGKDEFLKLLTVQLQNQDPSNPMKQEKMAAELAQFSSLEQLSNLNEKFDGLTKNQQVEDKFYGASFLGKEVVTSGSSINFEGEGTDADILFTLPKPVSKALVRIYDKSNNMVGEMWKENLGRGNQTITWDGLQMDKTVSAPGAFKAQVYAWDQFADPVDVELKSTGTVESVFFENGETVLKVDGKKIFLRDVDSFHTSGKSKANASTKKNEPLVNSGRSMGSPLNNNAPSAVNNAATNLPLAQDMQAKVNLNKINNEKGLRTYKAQVPTTGITSIYDE